MAPTTIESLVSILHEKRNGRGVLVVSHERGFVDEVADRVVELQG